MDLKLAGKTVIVTGGSKGIGAGICTVFAREGANIVMNYRSDPEGSRQFAESLRQKYKVKVLPVRADVTQEEECAGLYKNALDEFKTLDVLVNNAAGGVVFKPFYEYTAQEWKKGEEGVIDPAFYMSRGFVQHCIGSGRGGHIINLLSKSAFLSSSVNNLSYVAAKGALASLTRGMAKEFIKYGIYVNGIVPGYVKTEYRHRDGEERTERVRKLLPTKEFARPEEIGNVAAVLASSLFCQMIGAVVDCTGGTML